MIQNILKLVSTMSPHIRIDEGVNQATLCWFPVNLNDHFPFGEELNELMVCQAHLTWGDRGNNEVTTRNGSLCKYTWAHRRCTLGFASLRGGRGTGTDCNLPAHSSDSTMAKPGREKWSLRPLAGDIRAYSPTEHGQRSSTPVHRSKIPSLHTLLSSSALLSVSLAAFMDSLCCLLLLLSSLISCHVSSYFNKSCSRSIICRYASFSFVSNTVIDLMRLLCVVFRIIGFEVCFCSLAPIRLLMLPVEQQHRWTHFSLIHCLSFISAQHIWLSQFNYLQKMLNDELVYVQL